MESHQFQTAVLEIIIFGGLDVDQCRLHAVGFTDTMLDRDSD
jgi:hypothetical protein